MAVVGVGGAVIRVVVGVVGLAVVEVGVHGSASEVRVGVGVVGFWVVRVAVVHVDEVRVALVKVSRGARVVRHRRGSSLFCAIPVG